MTQISKIRVEIKVSGFVQGVGFRYFILRKATELNLNGYVKNMMDESVLIIAEGEKYLLENLISEAKIGPRSANVTSCEYFFSEYKNEFKNFEVRY